ncbi:MAG: SIMPL domain-containing protein [Nanoarchaeota archaeon]
MKKIAALLILSLLVFLAACSSPENREVVTASATSTIKVDPDRAVFSARIESLKDTAEEAQNDNSKRSEAVILALKEAGVPAANIQTEYYNIYKREDWTEDGPQFKGYQAQHTLKIIVDNVQDVGRFIDISIKNGADGLDSVNFELSDEKKKEVFKQALTQAGAEAKEKAGIIVSSVGAKLGKIVRVSESSTNYYPIPIFKDMAVAESGRAAEAPVQVKQLEVTATISVDYEIK